jgi:hypothetical protein
MTAISSAMERHSAPAVSERDGSRAHLVYQSCAIRNSHAGESSDIVAAMNLLLLLLILLLLFGGGGFYVGGPAVGGGLGGLILLILVVLLLTGRLGSRV